MEPPASDKLQKLQQMLEREPRDPFLLYGVGMEFKKLKDFSSAVEYFNRTLEVDPAYLYAYFQRGQTQELTGQTDAARESYRAGIAAARRAGDEHARGEIEAALELLG